MYIEDKIGNSGYTIHSNRYKIYILILESMFTFINITENKLYNNNYSNITNYYLLSLTHPVGIDVRLGYNSLPECDLIFYKAYDGILNLNWANTSNFVLHFTYLSHLGQIKFVTIRAEGTFSDHGIVGLSPGMKENENIKGIERLSETYITFVNTLYSSKDNGIMIGKYKKKYNDTVGDYNYSTDINFNYSVNDLSTIPSIIIFQFNISNNSSYWGLEFHYFILDNIKYPMIKNGEVYKMHLSYETKYIIFP